MLNIVVCIKQVPDTDTVRIDRKDGTLMREGIVHVMNPDDLHGLETALRLKDLHGGTVTALTMGPPMAEDVLREAFSLGADRAILVTDPAFAGSDTYITSKVLSTVIGHLGVYDIIVTGIESIDGNTSSVGYQISEFLSVPLITGIHSIDIQGVEAVIERLYGHEYQRISVNLPLLLAVGRGYNRPRFARLAEIPASFEKKIVRMGLKDIGGTADDYGSAGSPTKVISTDTFLHQREYERIEGNLDEKVDGLIQKLRKHNILTY